MNKYDILIIDAVNLAHKIFSKNEEPLRLSRKLVYKESVCNFIREVENLENTYLHFDGLVYILFDNYFSRMDLESAFLSLNRKQIDEAYKATRKKENREFFNSVNLIRYYYIINKPKYKTIRIDGLEADDLVKPLLQLELKNKRCLMVTSDLDWCRYLKENIDWLPHLNQEPETLQDVQLRLNFPVTETNLICYKAFFGDKSDNIASMLPENETNKALFLDILPQIKQPDDVIYMGRDQDLVEKYPILKCLKANDTKKYSGERRYMINVQLVSTLSCALEYLRENIITGQYNATLFRAVREALGLDTPKNTFVFGNIKRPKQ